ncbi:phage antirepressor KilAC domain-containing protein [Massilioclostridium coli]|uniref:phage antirepressor KilAC domain-containing protein n=1 Tax=Massilioclostridium coli TaxID=1870991 RepID=UPI0022E7C1ED|nr:phage antirepressor KilAC domain-containing protein [Massilioclostridium coli]
MNELQIIEQREVLGKDFKIYGDFENPLFLAKDVAEWIDYDLSSINKMIKNIDDDEKVRNIIPTLGGAQETWFVTENGLYEVLMQSRKPIAKEFKKQVKQILKSIRKHGAYMTPETLEAALLNPDTIIKIATALKDEQEKNKVLQAENSALTVDNAIMQPKADYFDELVDRNLLTNLRETAKQLNIKEREFIRFLLDHKYLYRDKRGKLMPYAQHIEKGLFQLKEQYNEKTNWSGTQTLITPKGRETFRLLYLKAVS